MVDALVAVLPPRSVRTGVRVESIEDAGAAASGCISTPARR
jgi:hypothetical protein